MNHEKVAEQWVRGRRGTGQRMHTDGEILYSYALPIGATLANGKKIGLSFSWLYDKAYSNSTSEHVHKMTNAVEYLVQKWMNEPYTEDVLFVSSRSHAPNGLYPGFNVSSGYRGTYDGNTLNNLNSVQVSFEGPVSGKPVWHAGESEFSEWGPFLARASRVLNHPLCPRVIDPGIVKKSRKSGAKWAKEVYNVSGFHHRKYF